MGPWGSCKAQCTDAPPGAGPSSSTAALRAVPLHWVRRRRPHPKLGSAVPTTLTPHSSPSVKTYPVAEVCTGRQDRGHAHIDQEGLPVSRPVCLLFLLRCGQLFLGGNRCLGTLMTPAHHPFSNFSVLTHAGERERGGYLFTLRGWTWVPSLWKNSGETSPARCAGGGEATQPAARLSSCPWGPCNSCSQGWVSFKDQVSQQPTVYVLYQEWKLPALAKDALSSISQLQETWLS